MQICFYYNIIREEMNLSKRDGLVKVIKACSWLIATVMRNPPQSNGPLPLQWGKVWWHWNCHRLFHQNYVSFVFWYRWLYGVWFCVQSNLWLNLTKSYSFKWDFLWSLVHGLIVWDIYIVSKFGLFDISGNYCVLPEYHKCMLPPLT